MQTNDNTAMVIQQPTETSLQMHNVEVANIDQLDNAHAAPVDLMSDYWTPDSTADFKRVIFDRIDIAPVLTEGGEVIDLECVFFFVKENGVVKQMRNGSKRLVGALQAFKTQRGSALEIRYLGKKQNRINSFKSDNWSVKPLVLAVNSLSTK